MKITIYAFTAFLIFSFQFSICSAQSWQWAKRMGGNATYINAEDSREETFGMKIDKNGNSYILFRTCTDLLNPNKILIDTTVIKRNYNGRDFGLASFDCSGKLRWAKIFGGPSSDQPIGLGLDTMGGVYIAGGFNRGDKDSIMLDTDTMLRAPTTYPYRENRGFMIIKYDTSGKYQWMRMPEPDTMTRILTTPYGNRSWALDLQVSPEGNLSLFTILRGTGAFASGAYIVPTSTVLPAVHILQYNRNGAFIKGVPLPITNGVGSNIYKLKMAWDWNRKVYYVSAEKDYYEPELSFGGVPQFGNVILVKFDNSGNIIWKEETTTPNKSRAGMSKIVLDPVGNLYFGYYDYVGATFGGLKLTSSNLFVKMNSSGKILWNIAPVGEYGVGCQSGAYSLAGNKVSFYGSGPGKMSIDTHKVFGFYTSIGVMQYIVDANTGSEISFDTLRGSGNATGQSFCADGNGNFYSTFSYNARVYINGDTLYNFGGLTDIAVLKYGDANCKSTTAINEADINQSSVKIYPNPANDYLYIDGLQSSTELSLYNIVGQEVKRLFTQKNKEQISIGELPSGMYLLQLKTAAGEVYTTKIVKQ